MILSIFPLSLFIGEYIVESRHLPFYSHANIIRYMNVCMCWAGSIQLDLVLPSFVFCYGFRLLPPNFLARLLVLDRGKFLFSATLLLSETLI